jgi:hypothetical protein
MRPIGRPSLRNPSPAARLGGGAMMGARAPDSGAASALSAKRLRQDVLPAVCSDGGAVSGARAFLDAARPSRQRLGPGWPLPPASPKRTPRHQYDGLRRAMPVFHIPAGGEAARGGEGGGDGGGLPGGGGAFPVPLFWGAGWAPGAPIDDDGPPSSGGTPTA